MSDRWPQMEPGYRPVELRANDLAIKDALEGTLAHLQTGSALHDAMDAHGAAIERAEKAEAAPDSLRARLEALRDEWEAAPPNTSFTRWSAAADLRHILAATQPPANPEPASAGSAPSGGDQ